MGEGARVSLVNPTPELLERFNIEGSDVLMVLQRREKITHIGKSPMSLDNIENAKLPFGSAIVLLDNDLDDISEQVKAIVEKDRMYPQFRAQVYKNITDIVSRSHINMTAINTVTNAKFPILRIHCDIVSNDKIEKLILKLKKLKEVKEISYLLI